MDTFSIGPLPCKQKNATAFLGPGALRGGARAIGLSYGPAPSYIEARDKRAATTQATRGKPL
eukprot:3497783-Amphidinium_carterae.1